MKSIEIGYTLEWQTGDPKRSGYYLATWLRGVTEAPTVSELWFNGSTGWFSKRGYIDGGPDAGPIKTVVAWIGKPQPFSGDARVVSE